MPGRKNEIIQFVNRKIEYIMAISESGEGKATLARLRKGIGRVPGEIPEVLGILLVDMPEDFMSKTGKPTKEEWACYTALTLFAMHQQGNDVRKIPMNINDNISMGIAMSNLVLAEGDSNAKERMAVKLQMLSSAKDIKEFAYHLKSVIQLLKSKSIPLNYALLAGDIFEYQFPEKKSALFLRWGQDFYRNKKAEIKNEEEKNNE